MKKKWLHMVPALLLILVIATGCGNLKQIKDEITVEAGEEFVFDITDFFEVGANEIDEADYTLDLTKLDVDTAGDYTVVLSYEKKDYSITVHVVDTTSPEITLKTDWLYTNDLNELDSSEIASYEDAGKCSTEIGWYEKMDELSVLDDKSIESYLELLEQVSNAETLNAGEKAIPTEEGIYRAVFYVVDSEGNESTKEFLVIYDTTAPVIEGLQDIIVEQEDVTETPEPELSGIVVFDNVDGEIPETDLDISIQETDKENHVYTVTISCTDAAGNALEASYTITVEKSTVKEEENESSTGSGNSTQNESGTGSGNSTQNETSTGSGNSTQNETSTGSESSDTGSEDTGNGNSVSEAPCYMDAYAEEVLAIINTERQDAGLSPVTMNETVVAAAKVRAAELVEVYSHTRPDGTSCYTALDQAGVSYRSWGENIAVGQRSAEWVMDSWMNSEGHRANILNPDYTQVGIACYYDPDSFYVYNWVQLFID